jgi:holo-[acyl-carrier protein] synthase
MIRGLGIDLVPVARIEDVVERRGERFLKRILTPGELEYCSRFPKPARHWAARFAVKEAAMKALGTGWSVGVSWKSIEVVNLESGQPTLVLTGQAREHAQALGATATHVTIAHDGAYAVACVILDSDSASGPGTGLALAAGSPAAGSPATDEINDVD